MKNRGLIVVLFVFACLGWAAHTKYQKEDEGKLRTNTSTILSALDLPIEELRRKTAVLSLEEGGKSLAARLWLLENAKHTIKIQYYSFARNISGLITCQYMLKVADRGVKIRLLVDEASSRMNEYEIKSLDAHENIEIKVFNAGLKIGRVDKRMKKLIENRNRLLYRMHNKTFVIDGQVAITGGRNISDEYFDIDEKYNFRDRDVVLFGKAAGSAEGSFDMFWEHNLSVPVASLTAKKKEYDPRKIFDKMNRVFNDTGSFAPVIRKYVADFPKAVQEARRADRCLILENVSFVSDVPTKNEDRPEQKGGVSTDTIVALIRSATKTVDIQSPYFITLDEGKQLLRETLQRGVRVRILTNSLASIDNVEAFDGYKRDRKEHVASGIELYEFRPDAAVRFDVMLPETQGKIQYKADIGLHSKTMIIDGKTTVIGSYNLDPMSANHNTESFAVIRSKDFSQMMLKMLGDEFHRKNAWQITNEFNPDKEASFKKRMKSKTKRVYPKKVL